MGVPEQNISCVRNTPELQRYSPHRTNGENGGIGTTRGETLLYVGKVDRHRGVETAIRAMPRIVERFPRATLRIIGSGTEQRRLADITRELGMEAFVIFEGWLDFEHVPTRIGESTICLIPHLQSEHTDTTVPNKIFDYMAAGKPVVASDCAPLKRIVRETRCGLTFKSGSSDDLSEKILQLLENAGARAYGLRGQRAVLEKYHWEKDCAVLLDAINHACSHGKQRRVEG
jgi:glycosyltransferase involved in cell wall biosynthesis